MKTLERAVQDMSIATEAPFHLKNLPQELRLKIYAHELFHLPYGDPPALFEALTHDEFLADDYIRAIRLYSYGGDDLNNFRVTNDNAEAFRKMPMKELLKIKHLTLMIDDDYDDAASGELKENGFTRRFNYRTSLIPNKCKLKNNFESVLLDLRDQSTFTSNNYVAWGQHVLRASSQPFRFIVSFTPKPGYEYLASRASSLDRIGGDKILRDLNWNTWD